MGWQPQRYYRAALARIQEAQHLHANGYFSLAMYVSGLAVECMLRAYRLLDDQTFDERHDLLLLWRRTDLANVNNEYYAPIYTALATVVVLWRNDYRFNSDDLMRSRLKKVGKDRGIKGDFLKYNSSKLYNAAAEIIRLGTQRWKRLNRK